MTQESLDVFDEKIIQSAKGVDAAKLIVLEDEDVVTLNGQAIHAVNESE